MQRSPKFARRFFSTRAPNQPRTVRVNTYLANMDTACTQIKERFLSMNSVATTFGIMNSSTLLSASDDCTQQPNHYNKAVYDTDISSALPIVSCSVRVFIHSCRPSLPFWKLSINWLDSFHLQWCLYGLHALADVASDRCNRWSFVLKAETDQKLQRTVSGASQWSGGSSDRKPSC